MAAAKGRMPRQASKPGDQRMTTYKEMMAAADAVVPRISPAQAKEMIAGGNALVLDVRDGTEVAQTGKLKGAVHIARGSLEGRVDPDSPNFNPAFKRDQPVILHCAGGGRAALAGKTLKDMGYTKVFNGGGFKDLAAAGIEVEK
jgi:rhodanese-related sulfurtransferase